MTCIGRIAPADRERLAGWADSVSIPPRAGWSRSGWKAAPAGAVALRLLVDRRDQLERARTETVSRLHHLSVERVPGGVMKVLTAQQARARLHTVRPRDVAGKKVRVANAELTELTSHQVTSRTRRTKA